MAILSVFFFIFDHIEGCARRIEAALRKPKAVVKIRLMDGQSKEVVLHAGYETSVEEINCQMTQMLHLNGREEGGGVHSGLEKPKIET